MSILLVDIGNTRIKWALWREGKLSRQQATTHDGDWGVLFKRARGIERVLVASVAGREVDQRFDEATRTTTGLKAEHAASVRTLAGVTTRYAEPWRLGVDRFIAVIGAHHIAKKRAACVIDVGTAMTIDLVDGSGKHHGGAIVPGPDLMIRSLLKSTSGIARRARGGKSGRSLFARDTRAAVEQGALHACAAVIDSAVDEARETLRATPMVLITGGAANRLQPLLQARHVSVPDLVLRGLAVSTGLRVD